MNEENTISSRLNVKGISVLTLTSSLSLPVNKDKEK